MNNKLTDKAFWKNYWEQKKDVVIQIPKNYIFHTVFKKLKKQYGIKTAIEIGGFPGYYSVYLKRYLDIQPTLLDYYIHKDIMTQLIESNGLQTEDVTAIEADLFEFQPQQQYDLVLSFGLIEHFENTEDIVSRHLPYLKPGGALLISLPNFRGVNGWFQRKFDMDNYNKHFIQCMDIKLLTGVCESLNLKNINVYYYGHFSIWLENYSSKSFLTKVFFKVVWFVGKVISKLFSLNNKFLSPYIIIEAQKPMDA